MNFGNFISGAGAFNEGVQKSQKFQENLQAAKQRNEIQKLNLDQLKQQIARDPVVAKNLAEFLSGLAKNQPNAPPPPQAPAPGQPSVPMQNGAIPAPPQGMPQQGQQQAAPQSFGNGIPPPPLGATQEMPPQQQGPQGLDVSRLNPQQIAFLARQNPQAFARGTQHFQETAQPQIPPYQAMSNAGVQQTNSAIPPPPQEAPALPRPNSMTIQDAAKFLDQQGITDPITKVQVLEKILPYLNSEAKQEAMALRQQVGLMTAQEKIRHDQEVEKQNAPVRAAQANNYESLATQRPVRTDIMQENADTNKARVGVAQQNADAKTPAAGLSQDYQTKPEYKKQVDYWADLLSKGGSLPTRFAQSGAGKKMYGDIISIVPERSAGASELLANQVGLGGDKAAARAVGTRSAAIELAANEARQMAPLVLETSAKFSRTNFPKINEAIAAYEKGTGDVAVVQFGAAINSFINAYARAINPGGVATVSDKEHAREILSRADSPEQVKGILELLNKEMSAAQAAPREIRQQQRQAIIGSGQSTPKKIASDAEFNALPSGAEFIAPDGSHRRKP